MEWSWTMRRRSGQVRFAWVVPGLALAGLPLAVSEWSAQAAPTVPAVPAAASAPLVDTCRSMGPALVSLVCACAFLGSLAVMVGIFQALREQGWSLANALSEPTRLLMPDQDGWSDSQGDRKAVDAGGGSPVMSVQLMEASSSRLIALLGSVAILLLYLGFGVFALFDFGLTCTLPATLGTITNFLYAGLALFAPYVANKVSSLFRPAPKGSVAAVSAQPPGPSGGSRQGEPAPVTGRTAVSGSADPAPLPAHPPGASAAPPHRAPVPIAGAAPAVARPDAAAGTTPGAHSADPAASEPASPATHAAVVPHVTAAAGESAAGSAASGLATPAAAHVDAAQQKPAAVPARACSRRRR
jgi:hypothetical protein